MRQELEALRDDLVQQLADFDRAAALVVFDGITEFIDTADWTEVPAPKMEVVDVVALIKALDVAPWTRPMRVSHSAKARTQKPLPRKATKAPRIARAGQKQRKRVARKSQLRRA